MGFEGIFRSISALFRFFFFPSLFFILLSFSFFFFSAEQGQITALCRRSGEFHSDPVCTDPVQNLPKQSPLQSGKLLPRVEERLAWDSVVVCFDIPYVVERRSTLRIPKGGVFSTVSEKSGKSTLWTNTGQDWNFQRTLSAIGPY